MKKFIYYLCIILFPIWAFADYKATAQHGPSPSDGDGICIKIKDLNIQISIYDVRDIHDFEAGKLIKITIPKGAGTKNEATKSEPSSVVGFKLIEAEIIVNPKTKDGIVRINNGSQQKIKLNWLAKASER